MSDPIIDVAEDDLEVRAAEREALENLPTFIKALNSPGPGQTGFAIKVEFVDGEEAEFMWLSELSYAADQFNGVLNNLPQRVSNLKLGDRVTVDKERVTDWLYMENGTMRGGYTVKVLMSRQP